MGRQIWNLAFMLKPLHDNLLVKPIAEEQATKAGIILPDTVDKERPEKGEVIAVGPGKPTESGTRLPMTVQAGNKVLFKKYSPDEIKVDGVDYLIISESDILAIIDGEFGSAASQTPSTSVPPVPDEIPPISGQEY